MGRLKDQKISRLSNETSEFDEPEILPKYLRTPDGTPENGERSVNFDGIDDNVEVETSVATTSTDIATVTITISGMDPVNIDVSPGQTVSKTIDDVPTGQQTVMIDLKGSGGTILYTQTQTVQIVAGKTASPTFPAEDFTPQNVVISISSPNGGEEWELGSTHNISWSSSHSSINVKIELYKSGSSYQTISEKIKAL
ncbi:MAG TPA: hypothetical protein EYO73_07450 [Sulfurimonas sp.]|nr:hypothetical protein [Sulfurimonas sp.]